MSKKEQIIRTAIRLFVEQGFENTPTSQISKEAEVATGTLFHHFKTKEELVNAAYLHVKQAESQVAFHDLDGTLDVGERMRRIWLSLVNWAYENRTEHEFMMKYLNSSYITPETMAKGQESWLPFFNTLTEGMENGLFRIPLDLLLNIQVSVFQGLVNYLYQMGEMNEEVVIQVFDILWDAITT